MFTRQQIEEIRKSLAIFAKKDTSFEKANPVKGNEEIAFVQDGKNVKMTLKEFLQNLIVLGASDFINLSGKNNTKYSFDEAILNIPKSSRNPGLVITYIDSTVNDWVIMQYRGKDTNEWTTKSNWKGLLEDNKFKGYYISVDRLESLYPSGHEGDYAYVGDPIGSAVVYRGSVNGAWINTYERVIDNISIFLKGNITIGSNGNWFQDGEDTGIPAQGPIGPQGPRGATGSPGVSGTNGITYKTQSLHKSVLKADPVPQKPSFGEGSLDNNDEVIPFGIWDNIIINNDNYVTYKTSAVFNLFTKQPGSWSDPIIENGKNGKDAILYRPCTIYTSIEHEESPVPVTPSGGFWNKDTDIIAVPEGWYLNDTLDGIIYMSTTVFGDDGLDTGWSSPKRITGFKGERGADGSSIEFIYARTSLNGTPNTPTNNPDVNDYVPIGWTDRPSGISADYPVEWVSSRTLNKDTGKWNNFDDPSPWSKWGYDGRDGDGVEYIFCVTSTGIPPSTPIDNDPDVDDYVPSDVVLNAQLQSNNKYWSDNPPGISDDYPYEWVSIRKQGEVEGGLGTGWTGFSTPSLWAKKGESGEVGASVELRYAKSSTENPPVLVKGDRNPSGWSLTPPNLNDGDNLYMIQGYIDYNNNLVALPTQETPEWIGPILITGPRGFRGTVPNYNRTLYKFNSTAPDYPALTTDLEEDDYPTSDGWNLVPSNASSDISGRWWQITGLFNGETKGIIQWGNIGPYNGLDGTARDGKEGELRFKYCEYSNFLNMPNGVDYILPSAQRKQRYPVGWYIQGDSLEATKTDSNKYLWMISASIHPDSTNMDGAEWKGPTCLSLEGPQGVQGPVGNIGGQGPQGVAGIPGVGFKVLYSLGTKESPIATPPGNSENLSPAGWFKKVVPTEELPYIWCIQTEIDYRKDNNGDYIIDEETHHYQEYASGWCDPFKSNAFDGINGQDGRAGQIVYPEGVYRLDKEYFCDTKKAPYVLDPEDGNYYIANATTIWKGTDQNNRYPHQDWEANHGNEYGFWVLMEALDAVYANVGVFGNALVGSAVFNGNYMFSQQGVNGTTDQLTHHYENFNKNNPVNSSNTFIPNICIDYMNGILYNGAFMKLTKNGLYAKGISADGNSNQDIIIENDLVDNIAANHEYTSKVRLNNGIRDYTIDNDAIIEKLRIHDCNINITGEYKVSFEGNIDVSLDNVNLYFDLDELEEVYDPEGEQEYYIAAYISLYIWNRDDALNTRKYLMKDYEIINQDQLGLDFDDLDRLYQVNFGTVRLDVTEDARYEFDAASEDLYMDLYFGVINHGKISSTVQQSKTFYISSTDVSLVFDNEDKLGTIIGRDGFLVYSRGNSFCIKNTDVRYLNINCKGLPRGTYNVHNKIGNLYTDDEGYVRIVKRQSV